MSDSDDCSAEQAAQRDAFAALADPASWPAALKQPAGAAIRRIDTHGAAIFLGDSHVLKAKRAVRFPFLDFSTLQRRRAVCETELRLNRRTAPEIYLGLGAVVRTSGGSGQDAMAIRAEAGDLDPAEVAEWLVVMRRFDRDGLLREVAQAGRLDDRICDAVAAEVARLHRSEAPRCDFGGVAELRRTLDGALSQIRTHGAEILAQDRVDALADALEAAFDAGRQAVEARRSKGLVRHVHGDLHLGNICLFDGRPRLFDCIEFNQEFAVIDILYDLAFLLMDLWHDGRPAQANRILNAWMEALHDLPGAGEGLSLLPLYLALRASIRIHVHCSMAAVQSDAAAAEEQADIARAYLADAGGYQAPAPAVLVAVGGLSGTGKSSIARALAPDLGRIPGAVVLRSDAIRKAMWGVAPTDSLPKEAYARGQGAAVYDRLRQQAAAALRAGQAVIADAVHADPAERAAIEAVARDCGAPFHGLWLEAPEAQLAQRLEERRGDVSDADSAVLQQQKRYDIGPLDWSRVDSGAGLPAVVGRARAVLPAGWLRAASGMA
ncbi:MAG: AAA family ATPase [Sneathiellaceae bacterium]